MWVAVLVGELSAMLVAMGIGRVGTGVEVGWWRVVGGAGKD